MTPKLFGHPFSSYTWKALIAFHETGAPFEFLELSPEHAEVGEALARLNPLGRFPVLETDDGAFWESSVIVEWAHRHATRPSELIPSAFTAALRVRERDRIFDGYVMTPVQTIVGDHMRPEGERDPRGVAQAYEGLDRIYRWLDGEMEGRVWAAGEAFTLADCAALPSLFYADWLRPTAPHVHLAAYLKRLRERPSVRRVVDAARPYRSFFPPGVPDYAD